MPTIVGNSSKKRAQAIVSKSCLEGDKSFDDLLEVFRADLEQLAHELGVIERRRNLRRARDLLRIILLYSLTDWSLRLVGAWASAKGVELSDVAVLKRMRRALPLVREMVGELIEDKLAQYQLGQWRVLVIDASTVCAPGAKQANWRLHVSFELGSMGIDEVELTDEHGGETLVRHQLAEGDIVLGDRIYSTKRSIGKAVKEGAFFVIRVNWQNLPLRDQEGKPLDILEWQRGIVGEGASEKAGYLECEQGVIPLRLVSYRLSEEVADKTRKRMQKEARRKGYKVSAQSLEAAGYMTVITNIWRWEGEEILRLYRFRWQVELLFKRLKSILKLSGLRAKGKGLAAVYLLGKLLAFLMGERFIGLLGKTESDNHPLSLWRLTAWFRDVLRSTVEGPMTITDDLTKLKRYFVDSPRRRPNQRAQAQQLAKAYGCA